MSMIFYEFVASDFFSSKIFASIATYTTVAISLLVSLLIVGYYYFWLDVDSTYEATFYVWIFYTLFLF